MNSPKTTVNTKFTSLSFIIKKKGAVFQDFYNSPKENGKSITRKLSNNRTKGT